MPQGAGSAEVKCCCLTVCGVSCLEDGAYSRVHCFDGGGEKVASQSRYNHGDENWNTMSSLIDDISPDSASCRREYLLVTGGDDDLRLLQLLVILHAVSQSWNQLVVHQVMRRAAVHNHGDSVDVGEKTSSVVGCRHPRTCKSLVEIAIKVEGRLLVVVGWR